MEEIPLVFPSHADAPRRYVIDTDAKRLEASLSDVTLPGQDHQSSASAISDNAPAYLQSLDEALLGAASVSSLKLGGQELLVTTSALVEKPHIISVALSWKKDEEDVLDSPVIIELDAKDLRVVTVRAFANKSTDGGISLVLVGCRGTIVSFSLDENLQADAEIPLNVLQRTDYIPTPLLEQVGPSELQGNMVSFLPSEKDLMVIALAPLIVTIDWKDTGSSSIWSETQCLEDMATRAAPLTGMITSLPSLILGKVEANVVDMAPTAAMCVSTNKAKANNANDEDVSGVLVFTLHSDASVRKWLIEPGLSMSPIEVSTLDTSKLSLPSTWSDGIKTVSLCARVYEQTFALAVYIKTNTLISYNEGVSDCNIWVFDGLDKANSTNNCLRMKIPRDAVSLVGMSFSPSERRCTLSAVFEVVEDNDSGGNRESSATGIKMISYPPSLLSIVSTEPDVVDTNTLDRIATTERNRIRALHYGSIVLTEIDEEANDDGNGDAKEPLSVDQALDKLDSMYMKHLFRPIFPRGNGTVLPPSALSIRRALSKLVHGAIKEHGMSAELETIKTLYEWRSRDKRKSMFGSPLKLSRTPEITLRRTESTFETVDVNMSVYDSFVEPEDDLQAEDLIIQDEYDELEKFEVEIISEVEAHESRWQRLLFQVWEEEQILRSPQCVSWMESLPIQVIVRTSVTTALTRSWSEDATFIEPWKIKLEEASRNILQLIEADQDKLKCLHGIEDQLTHLISNAQLAIFPETSITEDLTSLGRWACLQQKNSDNGELRKIMNQVPVKDLVAWIEDRPSGLGIFGKEHGRTNLTSESKWSDQQVAKVQLRHASCSLAVRATDCVRRSRLSKCLLVLELAVSSRLSFAAFRAYMQSITILWTSAQHIKMPDTGFQTSASRRKIRFDDDNFQDTSPPTKRSSFGDNTSSILGSSKPSMSTTLDILMIKISQDILGSFNAVSTPFSAIMMLSGSFVDLIFASQQPSINGARRFMPELSVLPMPQDRERATDHPDLALRILSSFVAFQIPDDTAESVAARKEELSSCLLHAAQSRSFSAARKSLMREMACDLLIPKDHDIFNPVQRDYTLQGLLALKSIQTTVVSGSIEDLRNFMQQLIPNATSVEIARLCRLATTRSLFNSFVSIPNFDISDPNRSHMVQIAKLMLRLSQILHRLNILEKYVKRSEGSDIGDDYNSDSLLRIISDAITSMEATFPKDFLKKMPEYISIWTKMFDHAVRAFRWRQAYNACVKNPLEAHRESNFKRLVRAMVDKGALNVLLDMCTQIGIGGSDSLAAMDEDPELPESIDLYEIASGVLLTYADCDVYDSRATLPHNTNLSDYQGALYALHVSQEQWRRAAQALDLRYVNAEKALRRASANSGINVPTSELRDGLIIQDLVLSACGSANAIQLVKDPDYRFIVSGEYGKLSGIQKVSNSFMDAENTLKRGRSNIENPSRNENDATKTRLSKFMVGSHLYCRAIRSVALRTLFFDTSTSYRFAKLAFNRGFDSSQNDVEELFKNGYYQYGLLLSKAWSNVFLNGNTKPNGEDLFGGCLSILMREYLVPLACSGDDVQRPTLQQLQISIDAASSSQNKASYVVTERSQKLDTLEKAAVKAAAFALIQKLTMVYSTASTPIALDVAASFLDNEKCAKLPVWLEQLLLGVDQNVSGGAFAPRSNAGSKTYLGDPSALLKLYTFRGMFAEACNVVQTILADDNRAAQAASRLPEKGNIDCVPYQSIDLLWNLIEIACSKGVYDVDEEDRILKAREEMKKAVQYHYECMQVSEMGMRSARMLSV